MGRDRSAISLLRTGALAAALGPQAASAQHLAEPTDPGSAPRSDRVIALYNFEEPDNPFDFPGDFFRAQSDPARGIEREGYPVFNMASFDFNTAYSGDASVMLPVRRGSVCLRLRPGALPVFADADYRVSCMVRAEDLTHARFRLVARYLDTSGAPIPNSDIRSEPILPNPNWEPVEIVIPGGNHPSAAFLQIDTEVIQPRLRETAQLGEHQVWDEDFAGAAWVDDILVEQLPRLSLRTQSESNIIAAPDIPEFQLLVRDLTGHNLEAHLIVRDHTGRVIDEETRRVESSQVPTIWRPAISRFGWYDAAVHLRSSGHEISVVPVEFCWVPAIQHEDDMNAADIASRARYGLGAEHFRSALVPHLDELAERLCAASITLGVWDRDTDASDSSELAQKMSTLSSTASSSWRSLGIALPQTPQALSVLLQADADEVLRVMGTDDPAMIQAVDDMVEPMLDRLGQFVRRWRIGPLDSGAVFWDDLAPEQIARARGLLSLLVPGPVVDIPWSPYLDFAPLEEADALGAVTVHIPQGTGTNAVRDVLERWNDSGLAEKAELTISLGTGQAGRFSPGRASSELVKRLVLIESATSDLKLKQPPSIELERPWHWSDSLDPQLLPLPEAAAWRATIDRLRGRRVAANLTFEPGTHVYLLTPVDPKSDRGGALVAWNDTASLDDASIEIFLGDDHVTAIDMWGNTSGRIAPSRLDVGQGEALDVHRIPITTDPLFIEGIDVELALFTSSIRLDNPTIQATPGPHPRLITMSNPWPVAIDGSLIITEPSPRLPSGSPSGWEIAPRVIRFSAAPGESIEIPVDIGFTAVEPAGQKQLVADVLLSAGPTGERIRAASKFSIELEGVELDVRAIISADGKSLAVEAVVTNTSTEPLDLDLSASARGFPRQGAPIAQLVPGASVVRRFMYQGGVTRLSGGEIYVSVEDPMRSGRLNKSVKID